MLLLWCLQICWLVGWLVVQWMNEYLLIANTIVSISMERVWLYWLSNVRWMCVCVCHPIRISNAFDFLICRKYNWSYVCMFVCMYDSSVWFVSVTIDWLVGLELVVWRAPYDLSLPHFYSLSTLSILWWAIGFANFVWFGCGIPNLLNTISSSMYCLIFHFDGYFLFKSERVTGG